MSGERILLHDETTGSSSETAIKGNSSLVPASNIERSDTLDEMSTGGLEATSSDETSSQTYIGKELYENSDPDRILLGLIIAQDDHSTDDIDTRRQIRSRLRL